MQHLEKVIIFVIMLIVLVYTVLVDRNFPQNRKIPISKQETHAPPSSKKEASFFPESDPLPEDEHIIEETFTEDP